MNRVFNVLGVVMFNLLLLIFLPWLLVEECILCFLDFCDEEESVIFLSISLSLVILYFLGN